MEIFVTSANSSLNASRTQSSNPHDQHLQLAVTLKLKNKDKSKSNLAVDFPDNSRRVRFHGAPVFCTARRDKCQVAWRRD
jgi:hypothetical protein